MDPVCEAVGDSDKQMRASAATAAAESAVLNMRAFDSVPCHSSAPFPFQPILTRGFTGVLRAVESVQLLTGVPSTNTVAVGLEYVIATWCQVRSQTVVDVPQSFAKFPKYADVPLVTVMADMSDAVPHVPSINKYPYVPPDDVEHLTHETSVRAAFPDGNAAVAPLYER